ncbi:hypothetical protein C8Q76DRAFT_791503 [Earliella scabrosa]|nr:hypothetical protein C8Q76DRAFT_791503 [Earliella scabrosa]
MAVVFAPSNSANNFSCCYEGVRITDPWSSAPSCPTTIAAEGTSTHTRMRLCNFKVADTPGTGAASSTLVLRVPYPDHRTHWRLRSSTRSAFVTANHRHRPALAGASRRFTRTDDHCPLCIPTTFGNRRGTIVALSARRATVKSSWQLGRHGRRSRPVPCLSQKPEC